MDVWTRSGVKPKGRRQACGVGILESRGASNGRKVDERCRSEGRATGVGNRNAGTKGRAIGVWPRSGVDPRGGRQAWGVGALESRGASDG